MQADPTQSRPLLQWRVFVAEAGDARYQALPRTLAGAAAFQAAVSKLVYDVLMIKARAGSCMSGRLSFAS